MIGFHRESQRCLCHDVMIGFHRDSQHAPRHSDSERECQGKLKEVTLGRRLLSLINTKPKAIRETAAQIRHIDRVTP